MLRFLALTLAILCGLLPLPMVFAAEPAGTFALVSDIHFDPFDPPELARSLETGDGRTWMSRIGAMPDRAASRWGSDTNHVLLASALAGISGIAAGVDFAIVPGDLLAHDFETRTADALDVAVGSHRQREFARRTTEFVAGALASAVPGKPVILALGNNDSECGDYEIEPGGGYLDASLETVRRLAGPELVDADFEETYRAGGYYAVRHPTVKDTTILVVNDILWSEKYRNTCGTTGLAGARSQMRWLSAQLAGQKAAGRKVWLVHHIPWGIDPFSTAHAKADSCPARTVAFLNAEFAGDFLALLRDNADIIQASFSGHIHTDDFRVLLDESGVPVQLDKVAPAISPVYGQNPGFQIFSYDRHTGVPLDYTSYYLANLASLTTTLAGEWREEYVFSQAYGFDAYSPASVAKLGRDLDRPGPVRTAYTENYNQRHEPLALDMLPAYACAIEHLDPQAFGDCYCGR